MVAMGVQCVGKIVIIKLFKDEYLPGIVRTKLDSSEDGPNFKWNWFRNRNRRLKFPIFFFKNKQCFQREIMSPQPTPPPEGAVWRTTSVAEVKDFLPWEASKSRCSKVKNCLNSFAHSTVESQLLKLKLSRKAFEHLLAYISFFFVWLWM